MANITIDGTWTGNDGNTAWVTLAHRLRVLLRAASIGRRRAVRLRLIRSEMRDPRWLADIGVQPRQRRRYDWVGEMARGMGGRM